MTIAYSTTSVDFGPTTFPEEDGNVGNVSVGISQGGGILINQFTPERQIPINGVAKSDTIRTNLWSLLNGNRGVTFTLTPDSHIDYGAGAGSAVSAKWINQNDPAWATKSRPNDWTIRLLFRKV